MQYVYDYDGRQVNVRITRRPDGQYEADIDGRTVLFSASPIAQNGWLLVKDDARAVATVVGDAGARHVHVRGQHYALGVAERGGRARRRGGGGGDLTAQMPAQILEVRVNVGDRVQAGQVLVVMEAMKMELRVTAPSDGVVKQVLVQKGQVVERGQRLLEFGEEVS